MRLEEPSAPEVLAAPAAAAGACGLRSVRTIRGESSTVDSLTIENTKPIENGDFERFLAFRLARIGIFL